MTPIPGAPALGTGLRVAMVSPEPRPVGGVPGMARQVARGLAARGHDVDMYTMVEHRNHDWFDDVEGVTSRAVDLGWEWGRWYSVGRRGLLTATSQFAHRGAAIGRLGHDLAARHRERPYDVLYRFSTIDLVGLYRHLDDLPPLVMHPEVHAAGELTWLRRERHLARRCRSAATTAMAEAIMAGRARRQRADVHRARLIVCPSRRFAEHLGHDYGVPTELTRVIPNPVDLDRFRPRRSRANGPLRILFVGRLAVRKGVDQVVELSRRLVDLEGTVELRVVGAQGFWSDYECLLDDLEPRIGRWLGNATHAEVADHLAQADLVIQPSRYEPFAITVAEALASGTPVIATTEVGAVERVDADGCVSVPPGRGDQLEAAVRRMVGELRSGRASELRRSARREAERLFSLGAMIEDLTGVLTEAAQPVTASPRG